jgi:hypothetical protein
MQEVQNAVYVTHYSKNKGEEKGMYNLSCHFEMDLIKIGWDGMDWIRLVQDRDQWQAVLSTVMTLRVP